MIHPVYGPAISPALHETLDSFVLPPEEDPHGQLAMVYRAFYALARSLADAGPNGPLLEQAVTELRAALDTATAAFKDD